MSVSTLRRAVAAPIDLRGLHCSPPSSGPGGAFSWGCTGSLPVDASGVCGHIAGFDSPSAPSFPADWLRVGAGDTASLRWGAARKTRDRRHGPSHALVSPESHTGYLSSLNGSRDGAHPCMGSRNVSNAVVALGAVATEYSPGADGSGIACAVLRCPLGRLSEGDLPGRI